MARAPRATAGRTRRKFRSALVGHGRRRVAGRARLVHDRGHRGSRLAAIVTAPQSGRVRRSQRRSWQPRQAPITVTLRASPARATLYFDDGPRYQTPISLTVWPDSIHHQLRDVAGLHGAHGRAAPRRQQGSSAHALGSRPGSRRCRGETVTAPQRNRTPGTQHREHRTQDTPARGTGDLAKVITKRPRTSDPDNPSRCLRVAENYEPTFARVRIHGGRMAIQVPS